MPFPGRAPEYISMFFRAITDRFVVVPYFQLLHFLHVCVDWEFFGRKYPKMDMMQMYMFIYPIYFYGGGSRV